MDRILVVEDERAMREIIRDYLTAHGLECDLARDGQEALELLEEQDYDAVVLDVLMPRLDGFGVCRAVRRQSSVPILFLTALGGEEETLRGYALEADDYVTKPFSLAVLLAKLQALIRRSRGELHDDRLFCHVTDGPCDGGCRPGVCAEGSSAVVNDPRHICKSLNVVYICRLLPESLCCRERRLESRHSSFAFQ